MLPIILARSSNKAFCTCTVFEEFSENTPVMSLLAAEEAGMLDCNAKSTLDVILPLQ